MDKKKIAVVFGGQSSEHNISKISVTTIINNMSKEKYDVIPVYISKDGEWFIYNGEIADIPNSDCTKNADKAILSPDTSHKGLLKLKDGKSEVMKIDFVFPVIHGKGGEDGTLQGLLELANMPYAGCGVLASAVSMDKAYTKIIADSVGISQAKYRVFYKYLLEENIEKYVKETEENIGYPCFVKPSKAGSSVGISKAENREQLIDAFKLAMQYDRTIIVEENIIGHEVECAVLGNNDVIASVVGEIKSADTFYSFDAKYNNSESKTVIPAEITEDCAEEIRESAVKIFKALDGCGLSRVDFFVEKDTNKIIFNEINTLPGFTSISMYPMLFKASGIETPKLIDKIIECGFKRYSR